MAVTGKIIRVRLNGAVPLGRQSIPMDHLGIDVRDKDGNGYPGTRIDDAPISIMFDSDERFMRVEWGKDAFELIPLYNVGSILFHPEEPKFLATTKIK